MRCRHKLQRVCRRYRRGVASANGRPHSPVPLRRDFAAIATFTPMPSIYRNRASQRAAALSDRGRGRAIGRRSWSPSMPARAPSARTRTGWRISSSTWCSRAARSTPPTATSTRRPSGSARSSTPTRATISSPSTSPPAPARRSRPPTCSPTSSGRPRIDGDELNRERGVVVQEIARANDQPSVMAEHLIDEAAFGDHPAGPPGARARPSTSATRSRATAIVAFRDAALVPEPRRRVRWSATSRGCPTTARSRSCSPAFRARPRRRRTSRRRRSHPRVLVQRARLQPVAPADVLPARRSRSRSPASARR